MTSQPQVFVLAYSTRCELSLVEQALNPAGRLLVLVTIADSLLHNRAYLAWCVRI